MKKGGTAGGKHRKRKQDVRALENQTDLEDAKAALHDVEKHGILLWEDTKRELGL